MRTRRTSKIAYDKLKLSGKLKGHRWAAYDWLFRHGPASAGEANRALAPNAPNPSFHRRLDELEKRGLVERIGVFPCPITGELVDWWDVTDQDDPLSVTPKATQAPRFSHKRIEAGISEMRAVCDYYIKKKKEEGLPSDLPEALLDLVKFLKDGAPCVNGHVYTSPSTMYVWNHATRRWDIKHAPGNPF